MPQDFRDTLRLISGPALLADVPTASRYLLGSPGAEDAVTAEPGLFQKDDGTVWLRNPDLTETQVTGGGGGGSQPVTREQLGGDATTIAAENGGPLAWSPYAAGTALVDLTDPLAPVVLEGGVYAVTVFCKPLDDLTVGANFQVRLDLDAAAADGVVIQDSAASRISYRRPVAAVALTFYIPIGGTLGLTLSNNDSGGNRDFFLQAVIQRLSGPE